MALDGPKSITLPEIPQEFPLPSCLHPFHYFVREEQYLDSGNPQNIENCVHNICNSIPYLEETQAESFKKQLKTLVEKLFIAMNSAISNQQPVEEANRFSEILDAINKAVKRYQGFSHQYLVKNIESLAKRDNHITNMLRGMTQFQGYLTDEEYQALIATYAQMRVKELSTLASYEAIARNNIPRFHISHQDQEIMQSRDECEFVLKYSELVGEIFRFAYQSERMKVKLTGELLKDFMSFCKTVEAETDIRIQFSDEAVANEFKHFVDNYYSNFKQLEFNKFELIKLQGQLNILKLQHNQKQKDRSELDILESKMKQIEKAIVYHQKSIDDLKKETSEKTIAFIQSIMIVPHREEFEQVCRLFRINPNDLAQNSEQQQGWLSGMLADSWLKRMGDTIYSYMPSVNSMQEGLQTTAKYTGAAAAGSLFAGPLGMMAAPILIKGAEIAIDKATAAVDAAKNTVYGQFTLKYQSEEYKTNQNLEFVFKDKAEFVNKFYVQKLFELDIAIANMSEIETKTEQSKRQIKLYQDLLENYKSIKSAKVHDVADVYRLFSEAVKMLLQHDYQDALRNTAESLVALREFLGEYKEYESKTPPEARQFELASVPAQEVQIDEIIDDDLPSAAPTGSGRKSRQSLALVAQARKSSSDLPVATTGLLKRRTTQGSNSLALVSRNTPKERQMIAGSSTSVHNPESVRASRESKLVKLSQKVVACDQLRKGTKNRLQSFLTLGKVMADEELDATMLKLHNNDEYRILAQSPLEMSLEDYVIKLIRDQNPGYLGFWFKERCFTFLNSENVAARRAKVAIPLPLFNNKTLWHLICEHPLSLSIFRNILRFQKDAWTVAEPWKFSDYFDLNAQYQGMNPLSYALRVGNLNLFLSYLSALDICKTHFTHDELKNCFENILQTACNGNQQMLHNARLFCEQLMSDIALHKYKQQSYLGAATQYVSRMIMNPSDSTYMEIMSALAVRMAKGQSIPTSPEEISTFLKDMQQPHSSCWHVTGLLEMDLSKTASNISQFIQNRSALFDYLKDNNLNRTTEDEQFGHLLLTAQTGKPPRHLTDDEQKLIVAILNNDHAELKKILSSGKVHPSLEIAVEGLGNFNMLYVASCLGKAECAGALYQAGTPVDICGPDATNPSQLVSALVLAAREGHPSVITAILDARVQARSAGYQRRAQDAIKRTALHYLAEEGDSACMRWIASEADTRIMSGWNFPAFCNLYDINGDSPLHLFANGNEQHLGVMKQIDEWMRKKRYSNGIADLFIDSANNAFIKKNEQGLNPITIALSNKNPDMFAFLLSRMIEANCLVESVLQELGERLSQHRELELPLVVKMLLKESKESYLRDKDISKYLQKLNMFAKLGVLAQDNQSLELVLDEFLDIHKEHPAGWRSSRPLIESMLEETLKLALINVSLSEFSKIVSYEISLARAQNLDIHSKKFPDLLQYLKGQGVDEVKLSMFAMKLLDEKLISQVESEKYIPSTPPLVSLESPRGRRKLTPAFEQSQLSDDSHSALSVESFTPIGPSSASSSEFKEEPPVSGNKKPDGTKK